MRKSGRILILGVFSAILGSACAHETAKSPAPVKAAKAETCGEYSVDAQHYYLRLLDEKGEALNAPDLLVDIEKPYDFFKDDPEIKDVDSTGKSCLKIEAGWATLYIFNESRHQARVARFAELKPGAVSDLKIESFPEKQMTFEYRECELLPDLEKAGKPMIYDLFDAAGQAPNPARFQAVFVGAKGKRALHLSRGSCVVLEKGESGRILLSDGRDAYAFAINGQSGENDRYLRIASKKKERFADHAGELNGLIKGK